MKRGNRYEDLSTEQQTTQDLQDRPLCPDRSPQTAARTQGKKHGEGGKRPVTHDRHDDRRITFPEMFRDPVLNGKNGKSRKGKQIAKRRGFHRGSQSEKCIEHNGRGFHIIGIPTFAKSHLCKAALR